MIIIGGDCMKEKNKLVQFIKEHQMSLFVTISAIIMLIGLSYAWLQITLTGEKGLNAKVGSLRLELDDTFTDGISINDAVPIKDEEGLATIGYKFTLENTGTIMSDYQIFLDDLPLPEGFMRMEDRFIKYHLIRDDEEIGFGLLTQTGKNPNRIIDSGTIAKGEKYTYVLKMWIDENAGLEVMGTAFRGQLRVEGIQEANEKLYRMIAKYAVPDDEKSTYVTASTGVDFKSISSDTNGKGIYTFASTKNNKYPVHYYRGDVANNNIKFAGFCWKIVRTTETGGTKIIYNGKPDSNGNCTNTTGTSTHIGTSKFNESSSSPADIGYMYGIKYVYSTKNLPSSNAKWVYGNDVEWDGSKYTLKDTMTSNTSNWATDYKTIATKYHYSCFSTSASCTEVGYIHFFSSDWPIYYIKLNGGKNIEDAKKEMFANTNDSTIKRTIDTWYQANMIDYTEKLEDTIWCNDRSIYVGPLKSKDEDSSTYTYTRFGAFGRVYGGTPSLECINENDRFTVSSKRGNGALTYPISMLTIDEIILAGGRTSLAHSNYYLYTGDIQSTLSSRHYQHLASYRFILYSSGSIDYGGMHGTTTVVRPVVSLAPETIVAGGNGMSTNPYIVK